MRTLSKTEQRKRRHGRVRSRVFGTPERPRLHVHRSLSGLTLQLVDDQSGKTILSINSKKTKLTGDSGERDGKVALAYILGKELARIAAEAKIEEIVFDRAGHKYHGRVKAVAEGARDGGLKF